MASKVFMVLGLCVLLLSACASQPPAPPEWTYEKNAIEIQLKSDPKLNYDDGVAHTLLVCLYQLKDPNTFNQLSDNIDGIYKLLECGLFDGTVATSKRIIVRPGKDVSLKLDRAEGAKYVAAAAGYYMLEKDRMLRLYEIPVILERSGFTAQKSKPGVLKIDIELGPSQIK